MTALIAKTRRHVAVCSPMDEDSDTSARDKRAIREIIERDLAAYLAKDIAGVARNYVQSERMISIMQVLGGGMIRSWGFDEFRARVAGGIATSPAPSVTRSEIEVRRLEVRGDTAWILFDQRLTNSADPTDPPAFSHNLRFLEKHDGDWKIIFHGVFEPETQSTDAPLIEVDARARVLSMNEAAIARIADFPGLTVSHGILRASRPAWDKALRSAISRASELTNYSVLHRDIGRGQRPQFPVVLGEDDDGDKLVCLVSVTDFAVTVGFDDTQAVERRLKMARIVYGLSDAQMALAREIASGHDLATAAGRMDISVNTARTHLRRMFDKTEARSQTALLRIILSLG